MPRYAILIDGGFLKRKLSSKKDPVTPDRVISFINRLKSASVLSGFLLHRIYYYDAKPLSGNERKPLCGKTVNFSSNPVAARNNKLFDELASTDFVSLRLGELIFRGWTFPQGKFRDASASVQISHDDLTPDVQQKGVDMRIGMDIAALTLKKHVDIIVLVTADRDFVPAMKFARREGAQLYLCHLNNNHHQSLIEHSDVVIDIDYLDLLSTSSLPNQGNRVGTASPSLNASR